MKQTIAILACILLSAAATAQTTTNGALRQSSVVVTNEVDAAAMAALTGYLPKTGGTLNQNATLTFQDLYKTTAVGHDGVTMSDGPFGHAVTIEFPFDINGSFILATREWSASQINLATGSLSTASMVTNIVQNLQELHRDSATNIIWRTVWSNGWCWVVAYTNYPAN